MENTLEVEVFETEDHLVAEGFEVGWGEDVLRLGENSGEIVIHVFEDHVDGAWAREKGREEEEKEVSRAWDKEAREAREETNRWRPSSRKVERR